MAAAPAASAPASPPASRVHRVEVRPKPGMPDPRGAAALAEAALLGLAHPPERIDHAAVYLVQGTLSPSQLQRIAEELLADPVTQEVTIGAGEASSRSQAHSSKLQAPSSPPHIVEIHPLPGVMDPAAESVQLAVKTMLGVDVEVRTGRRFDVHGTDAAGARTIATRALANPLIQAVHETPYVPAAFPSGRAVEAKVVAVPLVKLDDAALEKLSRDAHLFLSLEEMRAIQSVYRALGRDPREIELETLAQTWSEHCVHKTLKARIRYRESPGASWSLARHLAGRPGHTLEPDGTIVIDNLLKSTVAAATKELIADGIDWCLSVFVDNSGVIAFDDSMAVCFKCETHNHPSALEPYGGAATGIGGCIRDVMGTGRGAKPIAATDVFCVAPPDIRSVPAGCLHPQRILRQVVAGVRDYGNRMGIPTVNGAVWFDEDYVGNPLVYCGCIGLIPRALVKGRVGAGDRIVAVGGRTGRDGIHGATFSSAELTDTHADEFSHAVQIGNAITEKKTLDAILAARDHADGCLYNGLTDCGAGGFSSAVGEMGATLGAEVQLDRAPLKYSGLTPTEIWISEAQERMVLAVPAANLSKLAAVCDAHDIEWCDLGRFGTEGAELVLRYGNLEVGRMPMSLLHEGIPTPTREASWTGPEVALAGRHPEPPIVEALLALLEHPNIASKRWIIRQYDHEVQGTSAVKPLVGIRGEGPGDGAVIAPVPHSSRGLAIANGLATALAADPYVMALAAIDECVRNLVCVGADPRRIAILDNFSWPSCKRPENLGSLVRAAIGCYDGAKAYRTPFISGKDSLNNQFTTEDGRTIQIPPTLLISGFGIVADIDRASTSDAKEAGNILLLVGAEEERLAGSHFERLYGACGGPFAQVDLGQGPHLALAVHELIAAGMVRAAHDCSDGGLLIAIAEMCIGGELGFEFDDTAAPSDAYPFYFGEAPSRYLIEIERKRLPEVRRKLGENPHVVLGRFNDSGKLRGDGFEVKVDALKRAFLQEG